MKIVQNSDFNINNFTPKNSQPMTQLNTERTVPKSKEYFVSLINNLNESIKEYTKVTKSSFMEANSILISYENQALSIINLIQRLTKANAYNNLKEFFNQITNTLKIISLMKDNNNSNNNNLNLFLKDAKILFKQMKQAKQKENEKQRQLNNNNISDQYEQLSTESNGYNSSTLPYSGSNNSHNIKSIKGKSNLNLITNIYTKIMKLLNIFGQYNYIISKVDLEESNKFNILQNNVKKELDNLMILINKIFAKKAEILAQNKSYENIKDIQNKKRSNSINTNNEVEKLKIMNETNKKKIMELNYQLNVFNKKTMELEKINNLLNMKLKNSEQLIREKDMMLMNLETNPNNNMINNNKSDLFNELNQKNIIISDLQNQIKLYQQKVESLNIQINNINSQIPEKIAQYEYKLKVSNIETNKYKQQIQKLEKDIKNKDFMVNQYENQIFELEKNNDNQGCNYGLNKKIEILNLELKEKESKINAMNEELIKYQRKANIDKKQIEEMNMNILTKENVIKQKDELINNNSSNDIWKIKLENEKLKKQVEELLSNNNNYLIQNQKMINGNELPESRTQDLINKLNELNKDNQSLKETKTNLESEIKKKNEELEALQTFIFKLQSQLEKSNEINNKPFQTEANKSSKAVNKSFEMNNDNNTNLMNKYLVQLNDAEKTISKLQNQNKELKYKLEEKQVEKEFSGYRTEDCNISNYEEEFDLKKMVNGARDKNRSEDINIDYPGVQSIKDKYKELVQNMHLLEEQVKILICNININSKVKPQVSQICQLMKIHPKNIQNILAGKDKKKMLGIQ